MYGLLKKEMRWTVDTTDGINAREKDQLMWNIEANAMYNFKSDELIEQIFHNNKIIVEETFKKYKVNRSMDYLSKYNIKKNPLWTIDQLDTELLNTPVELIK